MIDDRIEYFVNSIAAASNNSSSNGKMSSVISKISSQCQSSTEIKDFLDNPNFTSLKAILFSEDKIVFTLNLAASISYENNSIIEIVFIKRRNDTINPQNISALIEVHSSFGSPLEGLYNSLHNIWNPSLLKNNQWSEKIPPRIQLLLSELESSIGDTIKADINYSSNRVIDIENISSIFEPNDEFKFWASQKDDRRSPYRSIAKAIDKLFGQIQGFSDIYSLDQNSIIDLLNQTFDVLNDIWTINDPDKQFYPQIRMEHLFDCMGNLLSKYVQAKYLQTDVWNNRLGEVRLSLQTAIQLFDIWIDIPRKLTGTFWSGGLHVWKGKAFEDTFIMSYKNRLDKVLQIRVVSDELCQLLTTEERRNYQIEKLFIPLENTKPLLFNPYTDPIFNRAVEEYEKLIEPIESAVSAHFRKNLSVLLDRPQTLLREFQKYNSVLQRPTIRKDLASERETLLSLLKDLVKKLDNAVDKLEQNRDGNEIGNEEKNNSSDRTRLLSPLISGIVYLRQIGSKVQSVLSTSKHILYDLDGYSKFVSLCESLLHRIKSEESGRFSIWLSDIQNKIDNDDPSLKLTGALMAWKNGILSVNFSDELVRFLREVRQLDELGFDIPKGAARGSINRNKSITEKALEADKYYRYGILLKKTANFYNSLSEQMIDIQQELLLDSLNAFGNIISKQSISGNNKSDSITWNNTSECEKYISIVQDAAEKLSNENRWLRKVHETLCTLTIHLMNIDLLKQSDQWKLKWKQIKETMVSVKNKYSPKDSYTWILHWDHQIYKALEASYQIGLESITENLSEIKTEIIFNQSNKRLEYKPSIEQLRQTYYNEMKKFINIPNNFEGFGNISVYRRMCLTNQKTIYRIYFKTELLFDKINLYLKKFNPWIYLAQVYDLDHFITSYVVTINDYQVNFKTLKQKKKDIEKLPDVEKIDCFTISLVPFKVFLDDLIQQVNDQLLIILRRNLLDEFKEVSNYIDNSLERLSTRPKSVEEIGLAKKQWKDIDNVKEQMKNLSKNCVEKKKLLLLYAPGTPIDISEISNRMANLDGEGGRWDDFDIALEAFNDMIEQQKEVLKVTLEDQTIALNENISKFKARWMQLKPSADGLTFEYKNIQKIFSQLDDWKKQFSELENQSFQLTESCNMFGMIKPRFDGLDDLSSDILSTSQSWDMLKDYYTEFNEITSQDWLTFSVNVYTLQDFAVKWADIVKQSFAKVGSTQVSDYIYETVDKIKKSIPVLKYCRGEAFKEDHWTELLQGKLKLPSEINKENVKVEHFIQKLSILIDPATLTYVKNLQTRATGEVQIREALRELKNWEQYTDLKLLMPEESGRRIPLVKDWKDLFIELSEKQSLLASLKESQYFKAFADQGNTLDNKIIQLDYCLHTLNLIQRKWLYLEPIFSKGSLPSEEKKFRIVDDNLTDVMWIIAKDSKLFSLIEINNISDKLKVMLEQSEKCQKALTEYLEVKRSIMPRFYFIGDDDLLEILGQAKNPLIIQSHLKKLFQGIYKVTFNQNSTQIIAMLSSMNETVTFETPVTTSDKVEEWLFQLEEEMRNTLSILLIKCLREKSLNWNYPSQILCLAQSIRFTEEAEIAIEEGEKAILKLRKQLETTLLNLTSVDLSNEPLMQIKMKSLVFDLVHEIDILDQLLKHNVSKEMLPRLVHTPLTDKCYLTLTQGMKMGFGGNPYGPAGTGKTESVKALAQCFGRQVLVFNCDEALESTSMIRIFIGIVKCGAWGCFDEFNRLKEDQLSAISQQIQIIQDAIKNRSSPINLLGRNIDVNYNSGIFVTLNPAGKGYGGRSRLPDNLKALFRPVAMGAPDNELIAEVSLVTEGFTQAKDLASKIVSLFKLSKQLLSQQQHYDWGLRALKAVLNSGGRLIQSYKSQGQAPSKEIESEILIKAVRVNTLSKLTYGDTVKFLSLIGDVFPGIQSADISGGELEEAIKEVIKDKQFLFVEDSSQIKKMIQLKESLDQRIGCVIVGPSGCGKSSLWRVLKESLVKCGKPVVTYVMNPKSMPRERLLGHMDIDTREWFDGVLTDAARKVVKEPQSVSCWIICDGDVDPEWIESLNSVLDDNRLLTLPNGERISFGSNINFLFETHDLKYASPATVSRMGMIFLSDDDLDIKRLIQKWLNNFQSERQLVMSSWIDELFYKALDYVLSSDVVVDTTLVGTVMNGLSQVKDANTRHEFICGLIRGLGGNLPIPMRSSLGKEVFQWANERPPDVGSPLDCFGSGNSFIQFTSSNTSHDIEIKEIGKTAVIPTISVQRTLASLENWINNMEPFILVGPEGCGKSTMIHHAFKLKKNIGIATLHCNAQTSADDVISKIIQTCSLYSSSEGRVYRPRDCDRLVLYLKDINLPNQDIYETCQLIAFLQQLITFDGFYDSNLEFLRIEKIQIVASMNAATTVGRHLLSTRFTAVVRILVVDYPEKSELVSVYDQFLSCVFKSIPVKDKRWLSSDREKLSDALIDIYEKCREKFTVDDQRHYLFTPRDITLLVVNFCRYDLLVDDVLDVLTYEAYRIFRDRLINIESTSRFDQIISNTLRSSFRYNVISSEGLYYTSLTNLHGQSSGNNVKKVSESKESENDVDIENIIQSVGGKLSRMQEDEFKALVTQGVMYYEREVKELNILLYPELLEHIAHIDRSLSSYNHGHLLLVGKSGVGRRQATAIASYMLGYNFFSPSISRNYTIKQFINDLKKEVFEVGGIKGEHITLFIEDYQIISNSILEIINSLISSGEVPGMYTHEELEPLLSPLREKMHEDGNYRTPYEFFMSRIRKYVHVVMCMDPSHPRFLYRCESNPALYSQCTILWMGQLRHSSMQIIPTLMEGVKDLVSTKSEDDDDIHEGKMSEEKDSRNKYNKYKDTEESKDSSLKPEELINIIISIHNSMIESNATPKDYLTLLQTWKNLYESKHKELSNDLTHLKAGLSKLESASEIVNDLRTNAAQQEKDLKVAQEAADKAMEDISKALSSATERRHEVAEVKRVVAENELKTQQRKKVIEKELSDIQPRLDAAKQAVGQIKNEHMTEIKSLAAPPEAIADVLAAVLMMLGVQDLSWLSMRRFLGNRGVKDDILSFDAKRMSDETRKSVAKLIKKKPNSFDDEAILRVSAAAAPMAAWVKANISYSIVIEKIEPLQVELEEEILKLQESEKRLVKCEDELSEIDNKVSKLKSLFSDRTAEAERLKRNLAIAGSTLDKAEKLINQLSSEQVRWKSQVISLSNDIIKLPSKMLLASGFTTYLTKESEDIREQKIKLWLESIQLPSFSFKRTLTTESELLQWKAMGLPSDDLSQENGLVIVNKSIDRIPFIIDPSSIATDWLKSYLLKENKSVEVLLHHDTKFTFQLELAVRFGKVLMIVEVDGVEPLLYPLCRKDLYHSGSRYKVNLGGKENDYDEKFRLFLITRNPQPDIPPDAASLVTQINFTITKSGLEGQLLGIAIQNDQPELEKAKSIMLNKEEDFKVQLANLEKDLLQSLAISEGNLLENTALIESLSKTKQKSGEIEEALRQSNEASIKLDQQREVYRPLAMIGSKLFFLIKSLVNVCHMYQYSLISFIQLFKKTLTSSEIAAVTSNSEDITQRLNELIYDIEIRLLYYISRTVFKADRLMFTLHLIKIMHPEQFQPKEWDIFLGSYVSTSAVSSDKANNIPKNYPTWGSPDRYDAYRVLMEHLPLLLHQLELDNSSKWTRFSKSVEAEANLPSLRVSEFQRVLIVQTFRPDRLQSALYQFCNKVLRIESINPPPLSLITLHEESNNKTPILLISSPGADPSKELEEYASRTIGLDSYEELAMGGGQQEIAIKLLHQAANNGTWLCLKNLHLIVNWLPVLEKEISSLQCHNDFRLWLTSEQHILFPSILLQTSLKATYESPPGIKKNLQSTFDSWNPELFDITITNNPIKSRLLFLLASFHAILQERRNFIPQGWTKFYEFSYGDLRAGNFVIEAATDVVKRGGKLDWQAIHGLMEDAIYGGRIDNQYDIRVLRAYLNMFFTDRLASDDGVGQEIILGTPLRIPSNPDYNSFKKIISQLSDTDAPYVFLLPDNVERSLQRSLSTQVIKQLRALSTLDVKGIKYDREKWRIQLSPVLDLWNQLTTSTQGLVSKRPRDVVKNNGVNNKGNILNPVNDFVLMEFDLSSDLCSIVDNSMKSLKKVLFGTGLLTPSIQIVAMSLLSGNIPTEWSIKWDRGPEKPQSWIRELIRKRIALGKWKSKLNKDDLLNEPIGLGDLFNPATFINALRQQTARNLNKAIDKMIMISSWENDIKSIKSICPLPCTLTNLLLQGATYVNGNLQEPNADANEISPAPSVHIGFVSNDQTKSLFNKEMVDIPVYLNPTREEFLMELQIPSKGDNDRWILAGVAIFLSDDE